jgi:flagellar protein FlaG
MIRRPEGPVSSLPPLPDTLGASAGPASSPAQAAAAPVSPEPTRAQLEHAVAQANRQMTAVAPSLQFEIDPDTQVVVIRLVDREDQRVLRQVPSAEMLAIARALERMHSLILRTRA